MSTNTKEIEPFNWSAIDSTLRNYEKLFEGVILRANTADDLTFKMGVDLPNMGPKIITFSVKDNQVRPIDDESVEAFNWAYLYGKRRQRAA